MKENLNNKIIINSQNNKLNLPAIWTKKKIGSLFLLILTNTLPAESGSRFIDCLDNGNGTEWNNNLYNNIVNYANGVVDKQSFCCGVSSSCVSLNLDYCSIGGQWVSLVQCKKIGQSKLCVSSGYSKLFGNVCGGIAGDTPATNSAVGDCPKLDINKLNNYLNNNKLNPNSPNFNLFCCNDGNCKVPVNNIVNNHNPYGPSNITINDVCEHSLMCFADNDGWSCTGNLGSNINIWPNPIGSCVLQVSNNPTSSSSISPTSPVSTSTSSPTPTNNNLAIGLGAGGGGFLLLAAGGLGLYNCLTGKWPWQKSQ